MKVPPLLRNCSVFGNVNKQMSATCLCPIYKMYFNHTIEPLQHVKLAHRLPCIISCFKFHVSNRADDLARRVPSGPVGLGSGIQ